MTTIAYISAYICVGIAFAKFCIRRGYFDQHRDEEPDDSDFAAAMAALCWPIVVALVFLGFAHHFLFVSELDRRKKIIAARRKTSLENQQALRILDQEMQEYEARK